MVLLGKALDREPGVVYPEKNREEAAAMQEAQELKQELFRRLAAEGAAQMGVADLRGLVPSGLETGVAVLVSLPRDLVRALQTAPTRAYYAAYHTLNAQLDRIVTRGADFLEQAGYRARAQTTSAVVQDDGWSTPLPHKTVATRAGLGWVGKSCLLVTRAYGSAVRLSSLVTDAPLPWDTPVEESQCKGCSLCVQRCPGQALTGATWRPGLPREVLLRKEICQETQLRRMKAATGIDTDLCGLCFAVCPHTQRYLRGRAGGKAHMR